MSDKKNHWQNIYQQNSPFAVSWFQKKPTQSLQLIHRADLHKNDHIIDIGGGASTLVDHLISENYSQISVLDISNIALETARKRLGPQAQGIEWYESDITEFDAPHRFDLWHDRAVFHFLTDATDRSAYLASLNRALNPGGHLIIATFAIGGPEKCSGLEIVQYDADKLTAELGNDFELVEEIDEIHKTPSSQEQHFIYFHLIRNP